MGAGTRLIHMTRALPMAAIVAVATLALSGCLGDDAQSSPTDSTTTPPPSTTTSTTKSTTTTVPQKPDDGTPTTVVRRPARFSSFGSSRLRFFAECPDLLSYMQDQALQRVTAWGLDGPYPYYYGRGPMMAADASGVATTAAPAAAAPAVVGGAPGTEAPNYSGTNTQEVGVDEGDIVETDGNHVFIASQDGVRIIDVAAAKVVYKLDVPDGSHQLLLDGTRLLVVTQPYSGIDTVVSLYDVADVSSPVLVHRSHLEGYAVAARAVDGTARLVLTTSLSQRLPFVHPDQFGLDEERALQRNKEIITNSTVDDWMPRWFDVLDDGSFGDMSDALDCSTVAAPDRYAGLGISWIASLSMHGSGEPVGSAGVVSNSSTVYTSPTSIYVATVPSDWSQPLPDADPNPAPPPTMIHKFALDEQGAASYVASGEVPGQLLNQFSMSELDGDLRVATTTYGWTSDTTSTSAVRVLRADGTELKEIGAVDGLGSGEQIYAVRFLGTQGYVVTFRQTDPLYVIDLSDPTAPRVTGQLKINGYSAYLHPVGDGLLLGVGQDATEQGRVQGTQLSLFDVHDPANPQRLSTLSIGGYSEVEWDHHAFLYWPEDGTIVIPSSPGWASCAPDVECLANGLTNSMGGVIVAQLQGTELVGRGVIAGQSTTFNGCWNPLTRSMVIGDELVTVGLDQMQFTDRATLQTRDSVTWGSTDQYGCYWYAG
jgi:hypothetical protein